MTESDDGEQIPSKPIEDDDTGEVIGEAFSLESLPDQAYYNNTDDGYFVVCEYADTYTMWSVPRPVTDIIVMDREKDVLGVLYGSDDGGE